VRNDLLKRDFTHAYRFNWFHRSKSVILCFANFLLFFFCAFVPACIQDGAGGV